MVGAQVVTAMISCGHILLPQSVSSWEMEAYLVLAFMLGRGAGQAAPSQDWGAVPTAVVVLQRPPHSRGPLDAKSPGPVSRAV